MAKRGSGTDGKGGGSEGGNRVESSVPADVLAAVGELIVAAGATAAPVTRKAGRRIKELGRKLDAAHATEAKRLRQLAKAEGSKGQRKVAKRRRQAADAAAELATLIVRIRDRAREAAGGVAELAGDTARDAGSAAARTARAVATARRPTRVRARSVAAPTSRAVKPTPKAATATPKPKAAATAPPKPKPASTAPPKPKPASTARTTGTTRSTGTARRRPTRGAAPKPNDTTGS